MNVPAYELQGVTKTYADRCVLSVDSLTLRAGEVFALIGPSGAGKSTLLRLLNFVEAPSSGTICYQGQALNGDADAALALRRKITMVFQKPILLQRSVRANVAYGLKVRSMATVEPRVMEALEQVDMLPFKDTPASTLSGGEAQRVALARALAFEPETVLLDEPTANLDPYNIRLIEEVLIKLNREKGTTIVLITHNIFQARRVADRVGLLLNGSLVEVGERERFFNQPVDGRTQAFIAGDIIY